MAELSSSQLRTIAHDTLCLNPSPLLQHQHGGLFVREGNLACTRSSAPGPSFNFVAALIPPLPSLDRILPLAESVFGKDRTAYGILVEGERAEPLESELKRNGYTIFEDEPAFVRPSLDDLTMPGHPLNIRQVKTLDDFNVSCDLVSSIFQSPRQLMEDLFPVSQLSHPDIVSFLGLLGSRPVSSVTFLKTGSVAHVAGTATLESERGKGFGAALVLHALKHAREMGCTSAALRSGPLSIPLYKRLGFQYVCQHRTYAIPTSKP
jgi:predicted GNAT family acetyltransferase